MWDDQVDWVANRSSKWRMVSELCRTILTDDSVEALPFLENGELKGLMDVPGPFESTSKILIYVDFTAPIEHLAQGLRFDGLDVVAITGRNSDLQRASVLADFAKSTRRQILIMSSIGNVGLNLQFINHIIFMVSVRPSRLCFAHVHNRICNGRTKRGRKSLAEPGDKDRNGKFSFGRQW